MTDIAGAAQPAADASHMPRRLLAPDVARGGMLLLIVLSNTAFFLYAGSYVGSGDYPEPSTLADTVVQFAMIALLDVRVYPLFAFLVGYGIVQTFQRRLAAGATGQQAAVMVQRRNRWLFAFGAVHAVLLLGTEVLGAYGLIGLLLCAVFLRSSERRIKRAVITGTCLLTAGMLLSVICMIVLAVASPDLGASVMDGEENNRAWVNGAGEDNYIASAVVRLVSWVVLLFLNGFGLVLPTAMLVGMWTARHRVLENPAPHLRLIRTVAVTGVLVGLAGALPGALGHIGVWEPPEAAGLSDLVLGVMAWTSGLAGGLGYVAVFVLVAERLMRAGKTPAAFGAVANLGKRSLSGYVSHSVVMTPVLSAWGLGLGAQLTSATMAAFAVGLWLLTVVVASAMERAGTRGPLEVLLRRLSYGKARRTAAAETRS